MPLLRLFLLGCGRFVIWFGAATFNFHVAAVFTTNTAWLLGVSGIGGLLLWFLIASFRVRTEAPAHFIAHFLSCVLGMLAMGHILTPVLTMVLLWQYPEALLQQAWVFDEIGMISLLVGAVCGIKASHAEL